jgi:3-hydroxyisobutyrate dehydrogenase-like beta-hydroxyacid dehydrogenase
MQKVLVDKLVIEMQGTIDPKVKTLEQSIAKRLGLPASSAPVSKGSKPAKAASQ